MRDIFQVFEVGTPFESESERGDTVIVDVTWVDDKLVYHAKPKEGSGKAYIVQRWIERDCLMQTHLVEGSNSVAKRTFYRIG